MSFSKSLVIKERRLAAASNPCCAKAVLASSLNPRAIRRVAKALASAMFGCEECFSKGN
jgi:hypothetical protein